MGSNEAISISDLANLVRDTLSPNKPVVLRNGDGGFQGRNVYIPDITRAKRELGLAINISLSQSIQQFLD